MFMGQVLQRSSDVQRVNVRKCFSVARDFASTCSLTWVIFTFFVYLQLINLTNYIGEVIQTCDTVSGYSTKSDLW